MMAAWRPAAVALCAAGAAARLIRPDLRAALPRVAVPAALPCAAPTPRAEVSFPDQLVAQVKAKFSMHSGYVNVTETDYLFYWLFGAQDGAPADAPVVVWSNGGPGCSAMEGATTEGGPAWLYDSKVAASPHGVASGKLSDNPYAWNQRSLLLAVDQPRYVGYSTGTGPYATSSVAAGEDMVQFLLGWRKLFPEHANRKFILASESYGGHYIPAWTSAVMDWNAAHPADTLPLQGVMIGNGIVNETVQDTGEQYVAFAKQQQLIPADADVKSEGAARSLTATTLGYDPNYYDYRLASEYNYTAWALWFLRSDVKKALNICGTAGDDAWRNTGCVNLPGFDNRDRFDYSGALSRALAAGIPVTLYYGEQDTACNFHAGYTMAQTSLDWSGAAAFRAAALAPLSFGGGQTKAAGGLTWVQARGAGHMVPMDNGAVAQFALNSLL